jgi:ketol-acid reductoisomerase
MKERKVYFDEDISLKPLEGRTVACMGYGHQGHAQSLNLKDNGINVIVGDLPDARKLAEKAGFKTYTIAEAAEKADILLFLIPDEVQAEVYEKHIRPHLTEGKVLDFAHGYTITYGLVAPPPNIDVVLMAPRMIGEALRERYEKGIGTPTYIDVQQDYSGKAWDIVKALARGTGCAKNPGGGAYEATFQEEVELDHFLEHSVINVMGHILTTGVEVLVEAGYPPELAVLELWGSGEIGEAYLDAARYGLLKIDFLFSSRTAQYGENWAIAKMFNEEHWGQVKKAMKQRLTEIQDGTFVREWVLEEKTGFVHLKKIIEMTGQHPINRYEEKASKMFKKSVFPRVEDYEKLRKEYKRL